MRLRTLILTGLLTVLTSVTVLAHPSNDIRFTHAGSILYYEDNVPASDVNKVIDAFNELPLASRRRLISNSVRVYVYPEEYETDYHGEDVAALALTASKEISFIGDEKHVKTRKPAEIYIFSNKLDTLGGHTIIHEVGHLMDDFCDGGTDSYAASNSEKFKYLSKKYHEVLSSYDDLSHQNTYNNHECYAEAYRISIEDPEYLKVNAPELYEYVVKTGH